MVKELGGTPNPRQEVFSCTSSTNVSGKNGPWRAMLCHGRVTQFKSPRLGQLPATFRRRPVATKKSSTQLYRHSWGKKKRVGGHPQSPGSILLHLLYG